MIYMRVMIDLARDIYCRARILTKGHNIYRTLTLDMSLFFAIPISIYHFLYFETFS